VTFLNVTLKESYQIHNFLSLPLAQTTLTYIGTFLNVAVIVLLKDKEYFNVHESEFGRVANDIIFYSQLVQILILPVIGYVYDLIGRKKTVCFMLI
jgi:hypothetical protein